LKNKILKYYLSELVTSISNLTKSIWFFLKKMEIKLRV